MTLLLLWALQFVGTGPVPNYAAPPTPKLWGVVGPVPTALPSRSIEWVQDAPSRDDLYWYIYRLYIDDRPPLHLGSVMCKGDYKPFQCSAPMPNIMTVPGKHRLTLTVARFKTGDSVQAPSSTGPESPKSNDVEFVVKQPPPAVYVPQATGPNTAPSAPVIVK